SSTTCLCNRSVPSLHRAPSVRLGDDGDGESRGLPSGFLREKQDRSASAFARVICVLALGLAAGCVRPPGVDSPDPTAAHGPAAGLAVAQDDGEDYAAGDYDPWQPFNEVMFSFNHDVLDRWLLKPVATVWEMAVPVPARRSLARVLDNLELPRRLVNNTLQLR